MSQDQIDSDETITLLRTQNDAFRAKWPSDPLEGKWLHTHAVHERGLAFTDRAYKAVRYEAEFDEDIDPHQEHSMGRIVINGETLWFKIDYYDPSYECGSEDPTATNQTRRVLTILFPEDY